MHALVPIILSESQNQNNTLETTPTATTTTMPGRSEKERLSALEAKAVAEATATADRAFTPSPNILNSASPTALLKQVDGPSLIDYEDTESVYVGSSVPIAAGGSLTVPIQVNTPGSIVEYAAENKSYDIGLGITAEREEGVTVVQVSFCFASRFNQSRVDQRVAHLLSPSLDRLGID
jgi:hypothetical protein